MKPEAPGVWELLGTADSMEWIGSALHLGHWEEMRSLPTGSSYRMTVV